MRSDSIHNSKPRVLLRGILLLSTILLTMIVGCSKPNKTTPSVVTKDPVKSNPESKDFPRNITPSASAAAPTDHRKCENLSESEIKMLENKNLTQAQKMKLIDTILVTLNGAHCQKFIDLLYKNYYDDPVADHILHRSQQAKRMTSKDIVDIAYDSISQKQNLSLPSDVIWAQVSGPITIEKLNTKNDTVRVKGFIKDDGRVVEVVSEVKSKELPQNPKPADVAKITAQESVTFAKKDDTETIITVGLTSKPQQIAQVSFDEILTQSKNDQEKASVKNKNSVLKAVFDTTDMAQIEECDNNGLTRRMLVEKRQEGAEQDLRGIELSPDMITTEVKGRTNKELAKIAIEQSSKQKRNDLAFLAFWHFGKNNKAFNLVSPINIIDPTQENPEVRANLLLFEFENEKNQVTKTFVRTNDPNVVEAAYALPSPPALDKYKKQFIFSFDAQSAYWLKMRLERVATCLEKNGVAAADASRDSLRSYTLMSMVKNNFDYYFQKTQ